MFLNFYDPHKGSKYVVEKKKTVLAMLTETLKVLINLTPSLAVALAPSMAVREGNGSKRV